MKKINSKSTLTNLLTEILTFIEKLGEQSLKVARTLETS